MASFHSPQGYVYEMCNKRIYVTYIHIITHIQNLQKGHSALFQKTETSYHYRNHLLNSRSFNAH